MRHLIILFLLLSSFLMTACDYPEESHGYPKKIYLPSKGGTRAIVGETSFRSFIIKDESDESDSKWYGDTLVKISHKWLTLKQKLGCDTLIVTAEPAPSNQKRKITVEGSFGDSYTYITVIQGM